MPAIGESGEGTGVGEKEGADLKRKAEEYHRDSKKDAERLLAALMLATDKEGKFNKEILAYLSKQDRGLTHPSKLEEQAHYQQGIMMNIMKRAELREMARGKPHIPNIAAILAGRGAGGSVIGGLGRAQGKIQKPFEQAWEFQKKQKEFEREYKTKLNIPKVDPKSGLTEKDLGGNEKTRKARAALLEEQKKIFSPLLRGRLGALIGKVGKGMESPLGQAGGAAGGLIIGVMTKAIKMGIEASPMMQAMLKITQTAMMLFLRPIGDFIGGMLRPIALFFMREVAIPALRAGKGMMSFGTEVGKGILGFVLKPIESMQKMLTGWADQLGLTAFLGGKANLDKWERYDPIADWKADKKIESMLAVVNSVLPEDGPQVTRAQLLAFNALKTGAASGLENKDLVDEMRKNVVMTYNPAGAGMSPEEIKKAWEELPVAISAMFDFADIQAKLDEMYGVGTQYAGALEHGATLVKLDLDFQYVQIETELDRFSELMKNFNDTNEGLVVAVDAAGNPIDPKILDTQTDVDTADAIAVAEAAYQKIAQVHFMTGGGKLWEGQLGYKAWKDAGGGRQVGEGIEGWGEEGTMVRDWDDNLVSKSHLINNAERRAMAAEEQEYRRSRGTWMSDRLAGARAGFDANDRSSFGGSSYFGTAGFAKIWMAATGGNALGAGGMNLSEAQQDAEKLRWLMEMQKREGGLGEMGGIYKQLADIGLTPAEFLAQTTARAQPTTAQNEAAEEFTRVTVEGTEAMDELKDSVEGTIAPQDLNTVAVDLNTVAIDANTAAVSNIPAYIPTQYDPQAFLPPPPPQEGGGGGYDPFTGYVGNVNLNPMSAWNQALQASGGLANLGGTWGGTQDTSGVSAWARSLTTNAGLAAAQAAQGGSGNTISSGSWGSSSSSTSTGSAMSANTSAAAGPATGGFRWAQGGWITEPIFGFDKSGNTHLFGEAGPELVTPANKVGGIVANISINIDKIAHDIDLEQIKPIVERALLEVHSRRGII